MNAASTLENPVFPGAKVKWVLSVYFSFTKKFIAASVLWIDISFGGEGEDLYLLDKIQIIQTQIQILWVRSLFGIHIANSYGASVIPAKATAPLNVSMNGTSSLWIGDCVRDDPSRSISAGVFPTFLKFYNLKKKLQAF